MRSVVFRSRTLQRTIQRYKRSIGNSGTQTLYEGKTCSSCGQCKPLNAYFYKRSESRHESACKDCKREGRKKRRTAASSVPVVKQVKPPIEERLENQPERTIEPAETGDVAFWSAKYGRKVTAEDVREIKSNLGLFFTAIEEFVSQEQYERRSMENK